MSINESNFNLRGAESLAPADGQKNTARAGAWQDQAAASGADSLPPDLEAIRQHWERRGRKYGLSPSASWVDETMLHREGTILAKYIQDGDRVLDAGCANGYTTLQLARLKEIRITGIDYAQSMIDHANVNLGRAGFPKGTASFRVGNFLNLDFPDNTFDKVFTKRCLINMGSAEHQKKALLEAWRVLKPGGLFLISEVSTQSSDNLNELRQHFGLEAMTPLWHNCYLEEDDFFSFAEPYFNLKKVRRFSSTYYVLTWAVYPFFVRNGQRNYRGWFHRLAAVLPQVGDWGLQKLYILQKKG